MADPPPIPDRPAPAVKTALRAQVRKLRRVFVRTLSESREVYQDQACRFLLQLLHEAERIAFYRAQPAELDPFEAMETAVSIGRITALPRMDGSDAALRFQRWRPGDPLIPGAHGIEEPRPDSPVIVPDAIVLPLVAFDRAGRRLGQGGGYYDRTLAAFPDALRIGLAWSVQEVDEVPVEPSDMVLDAVVTEREWIECR